MLNWTTGYEIPINLKDSSPHRNHVFTYGSDVYIVIEKLTHGLIRNRPDPIEMFVFKPELGKVKKVNCPFSSVGIAEIHTISCSDGQIYFWVSKSVWRRSGANKYFLYNLDMTTMKFVSIISMRSHEYHIYNAPIIGDLMYVLDGRKDNKVHVINLKTKTMVERYVLKKPFMLDPSKYSHDLMAKDGELYLVLRSTFYKDRMVSIVEDRRAICLVQNDDRDERVFSTGDWMDGSMFHANRNKRQKYGFLDTFDFWNLKWVRQKTEKGTFIDYNAAILASVKVDDKIYAVFRTGSERTEKMEIRVMEAAPKLSTICLRGVVEEVLNDTFGYSLEMAQQLPLAFDTKKKLDGMLKWRRAEKVASEKYELYRKQNDGLYEELSKMNRENLIDDEFLRPMFGFLGTGIPHHLV